MTKVTKLKDHKDMVKIEGELFIELRTTGSEIERFKREFSDIQKDYQKKINAVEKKLEKILKREFPTKKNYQIDTTYEELGIYFLRKMPSSPFQFIESL